MFVDFEDIFFIVKDLNLMFEDFDAVLIHSVLRSAEQVGLVSLVRQNDGISILTQLEKDLVGSL